MSKDIYENFNDIEIDVEAYEEASVTEFDKQKVLLQVKQGMQQPRVSRWKKSVMAAAMSVGLSAAALFGLSFTSFAHDLPVLGNLFQFFGGEAVYVDYSEHAEKVEATATDADIEMTMNEVVFDGDKLYLTYTLNTTQDLGEAPHVSGIPNLLDGDGEVDFYAASGDVKKINDQEYVGMMVGHLLSFGKKTVDRGEVSLVIEKIFPDPALQTDAIEGEWAFQFPIQRTDNRSQAVNSEVGNGDVKVELEKVLYTPMSVVIFYDEFVTVDYQEEWDFIVTDLIVTDDLGNVYESQHHGGYSNSLIHLYNSIAFEQLHADAKTLYVTPTVEVSAADDVDAHGGKTRKVNSTAPMETYELETIVIDIQKE